MRWLLFFIPFLSWGQCDLEIVGFDPLTTDMTLAVNGASCMTESDSIGEFLLGLTFSPPVDVSDEFPCFYPSGWALLIFPLDFPGFEIGQGPDNILQTGDTLTFRISETPLSGSGTADCWVDILQEAAYFEECVVTAIYQINDSPIFGELGYPDEDPTNSFLFWSLNGACDPPPPPIVPQVPVEGDECDNPFIHTPNTFTPNGDGVNEYWKPVTRSECWWRWECRIFNRWGTLVWVSYDPQDKWLGNRLGSLVPDGVYFYTIKATTFKSTKAVSINGQISVFR